MKRTLKEIMDGFGIPFLEQSGGDKVTRDAFLYLEPKEDQDQENYAQCSSCALWTTETCYLHDANLKVPGDATCGFYVYGKPNPDLKGKELGSVTPKESDFSKILVQCHRCVSYENDKCLLFKSLNEKMPEKFDLLEDVHEHGCCNAMVQKEL